MTRLTNFRAEGADSERHATSTQVQWSNKKKEFSSVLPPDPICGKQQIGTFSFWIALVPSQFTTYTV